MKPTRQDKHKARLDQRTKNWGKAKFKPKKYVRPEVLPEPQATAKPWQHVKNDIIDDSEDRGHQDVDSEDARKFMQQREQNHRRNIIEANRSETTIWESFDEEQFSTSKEERSEQKDKASNEKSRLWECDISQGELPTVVENFSIVERNFYKRRITLGLKTTERAGTLQTAINDLKKNQSWARGNQIKMPVQKTREKEKKPFRKNNPFHKKGSGEVME
uniref:Uncharacterized protein LOC108049124 n=1 Tax=Drosophila rhopaloa TaxID=1041015 RepID=A0A6P4F9B9_DRORH